MRLGEYMSISQLAPKSFPKLHTIEGIDLCAMAVGFKYTGRLDYFLARLCTGAAVSGAFTKSSTRSSAVDYCRDSLALGGVRVLAVNSGNSNAFTGRRGQDANIQFAEMSKKLAGVDGGVVPCSTGVIGEVLDITPLQKISTAHFDSTWQDCANAILTTDTFAKGATSVAMIGDTQVKISGIAKGSGMIAPDMATMLAYIFTDATIEQSILNTIVKDMTDISFNSITVDGDTSTSDSVVLCATGKAGNDTKADLSDFKKSLQAVFIDLAQQIVKDGEGATKFITVTVKGADDAASAKAVALSIANSPLVKTAIAGQDANWGRIVMAVGKSGQNANRDTLSITVGGVVIADKGEGVEGYDELPVSQHLQGSDINIDVNLNIGDGHATVWTCDLTHGYITINADYRS